ncbi:hypothetical protein K1T71_004482 [Dendrolimus kikuchii]|uniref:Uncharacterized protein n=1 Tax=Dendrolimus kikuchii TaxID=765133 RepID=A0ACC1D7L7_9NEOP|nr:hypothetical protein K1T71_004482 [Dendrolimus kikuchii]
MKRKHRPWPLVPGGPASPGYGSGRGNYGEEGARNLRVTGGCQRNQLTLATYNGRTIRLDNHLAELEVELSHIKWHILGLSEVRREGEDTITLESGHLLYFREGDKASQGGVGFLVNKSLVNNVVEVSSVSNRVAYLVLKLTNRYSLKVIQVYAPTSAHPDEEVEAMYEDITKAIHGTTSAHYNVVMGDFNAKVGVQECDEPKIGPYGLGRRNHRGQMLVNFLEMQGLFLMNSFYKKKLQRRWTWQSPDTVTKNEIDFIMADKKHIFRDVSVVNRFNTGSDHRLIRGTLNIDFKAERLRLIKSNLRPTPPQIILGSEQFQLELQNRFESLETTGDVDEITDNVVKTMRELGRSHFPPMRRSKRSELSTETLDLMRMRREMPSTLFASPEHRALSKRIRKLKAFDRVVRKDLWDILPGYGINGKLMRAVQSTYEDCMACVRVESSLSPWFDVNIGVRQGCVLSALLFILYLDDCLQRIRLMDVGVRMSDLIVSTLLYADDAVLLAESPSELQTLVTMMKDDCQARGLHLNAKKTKVMVFEREETRMNARIMVDNFMLEQVNEFVYLGCAFSRDGRYTADIERRLPDLKTL